MDSNSEGHHGGAWKVAYADFVMAMMALFMVLWISAQDDEILIATSDYFANPFNSPMEQSLGVMPNTSNSIGGKDADELDRNNMLDVSMLYELAREFYRLLNLDSSDDDKPLEVEVTSDGLRITVFDRLERPFFRKNSAELTEWGEFAIQNLAWIMDRYNHRVRIDAHTPARGESAEDDYDPWELSVNRANEARRRLVYFALDEKKIERVTGFADTHPLPGHASDSIDNQHLEISMVLQ